MFGQRMVLRALSFVRHQTFATSPSHDSMMSLICPVACALVLLVDWSMVNAQESFATSVPSRARLDYARQLIRHTPCPGDLHNPLRVIQTVNCLRALGKTCAISLLLEIASTDRGPVVIVPNDKHESQRVQVWNRDDQRACMIVPLLFDVPDNGTPPPDAWYCKQTHKWRGAAGTQVIQGGIPFAITGQWNYSGSPFATRRLVEWAAKHGILRATELHPQDNPLQAADVLHDRIVSGVVLEFEQCWGHVGKLARAGIIEDLQSDLRAQATRMLPKESRAAGWRDLQQLVKESGLSWDQELQVYRLRR